LSERIRGNEEVLLVLKREREEVEEAVVVPEDGRRYIICAV